MTDVACPHVSGVFVQGGEDVIHVEVTSDTQVVNGGQLSHIGLQVDSNITFTKRIRFLTDNGFEVSTITTRDNDRGPLWFQIGDEVTNFEVCKGKLFDVVTGMYQVSIGGFPFQPGAHGRRMLFIWKQD